MENFVPFLFIDEFNMGSRQIEERKQRQKTSQRLDVGKVQDELSMDLV